MSQETAQITTKERLLEAAGEVFAEKGYRDATVRDICSRAGANLAAVNYHFRDKDSLYAAVFEHARMYESERYPIESFASQGTPQERLAVFIRQFCRRLFDRGRPNWHVKLMAREMVEPTGELNTIVDRAIRPKFEILRGIVADMTGLAIESISVELCTASIIGQCLHHHHCREVSSRLCVGWLESASFIDDLASHVTWFSTRALEGIRTDLAAGCAPSIATRRCPAGGDTIPTPPGHARSGPAPAVLKE